MKELVLASGNAGKLREFNALFAELGWRVRPQSDFAVPECPEPYVNFVENALAKARHASRNSGLPALADDSGICAPALNGAPGVLSARYAGAEPRSDAANNAKLSADLAAQADRPQPLIAEGVWHGQWQEQAAGSNGFGYDPHFYLPELQKTAAQLDPDTKNQLSHRAQALRQLLEKILVLDLAD